LQVIIFQEQIFKRFSLGAKERRVGADSCQKYEDLIQKYLMQGFMPKIWRSHTKNILCKEFEDLVQKYNKVAHPFYPFAAFASLTKAAYFSISDLEPMVSCATI